MPNLRPYGYFFTFDSKDSRQLIHAHPIHSSMKKTFLFFLLVFAVHTANAQLTLHCDSILQTSTCAGGNVIVPFTVTGGNFNFGNTFTAQLSDNWGSFANPVNIGSIFWFSSGVIFAQIPANANFGFLYRVRIISSNPADTSNTSPNTLIVTQVAQLNTIVATPGDTACVGDTVTLFAVNPAASYSWSTGDTTQSIQVTQPGTYSVTTTDFLTCQSTTADTIVFQVCSGIAEMKAVNQQLFLYPNPAGNELFIRLTAAGAGGDVIRFTNMLGQELTARTMNSTVAGEIRFDVSAFPPGLYSVVMEQHDGNRLSGKFVVR